MSNSWNQYNDNFLKLFSYAILRKQVQSNLYQTTTRRTTQKLSSWAGGGLIKHLYKMATNHI